MVWKEGYRLNIFSKYGYLAIIISSILEGTSIPFPGLLVFIMAGLNVYKGELNMFYGVVLGGISYSLAALIPYFIGRHIKDGLFKFLQTKLKVSSKKINSIESFFHKYGEFSVFISRPLLIGNYISYFAGLANINILKFLLLTFFGILPWNLLYLYLGYYFQGNIDQASDFLKRYNLPITIAILIVIIGFILFNKYKNKDKDY